jgi:hypothetical protein
MAARKTRNAAPSDSVASQLSRAYRQHVDWPAGTPEQKMLTQRLARSSDVSSVRWPDPARRVLSPEHVRIYDGRIALAGHRIWPTRTTRSNRLVRFVGPQRMCPESSIDMMAPNEPSYITELSFPQPQNGDRTWIIRTDAAHSIDYEFINLTSMLVIAL